MSNEPNDDTLDFPSDGEDLSPLFQSTPASSSESTDSSQQSQVSQVRHIFWQFVIVIDSNNVRMSRYC